VELNREIQEALRDLAGQLSRLNVAVGDVLDLRGGDLAYLDLIDRQGPLSPSQLAAMTGTHPATLTGVIDRLERGGWVARRPDPADRRKVRLEAARERGPEVARLYGPMSRSIARLCSGYSAEELRAIHDFLVKAVAAGEAAVATVRHGAASDPGEGMPGVPGRSAGEQ